MKSVLLAHDPDLSGVFPVLAAIALLQYCLWLSCVLMSASASTASDTTALQKSGSTVDVLSVSCIYVHVHSPELIAGIPKFLLTHWESCHGGWVTGDSTGAFAGLSPNF